MADQANTEDGDAGEGKSEAPAGGSKKKLIIIALAGVLGLGAAGGGGWWFFLRKKPEAQAAAAQAPKKIAFVELKDMMVNLSQTQGVERQNFLKLKIALEVGDPKLVTEIQPLLPRIEDTFQIYMRELRANELEGSSAVIRLKEELLKRVNIAVHPAKVDAVLFKEVLMQ